jgi:hypothetical protein
MSDVTTDFIRATKKIHADVRGILASLHLVREDVKIIREQAVEHADKERSNQHANDSDEEPAKGLVHGSQVAHANATKHKKYEGESKTRRTFRKLKKNFWRDSKKPKTYVEFAALLFLIIYTCETRRTNNLTKSTLENSKRQFVESQDTSKRQFYADQRPYIWLTNNLGGPTFLRPPGSKGDDGYVVWDWHYTNYGKTPARDVRFNQGMQIGDEVLNKPRVFDGPEKTGAPLPPNKDDFTTSFFKTKISSKEFNRLTSNENTIVVYGHFTYTDSAGNQYETALCMYHLKLGPISYCPEPTANYIK